MQRFVRFSFRVATLGILSTLILALAGCPSTPIHIADSYTNSSQNNAEVKTLSVDAKQRVVSVTYPGNTPSQRPITCAEPSPDALTAISSALSADVQKNADLIAKLSASSNESASSIGLRTQSIQLLRDGMYRSCEAYASGAISANEYNRQQRRYQNLMLGLLAIEQLTGAVVAQQVGLGKGSANSTAGMNLDNAIAAVSAAGADLTAKTNTYNDAVKTQKDHKGKCDASADKNIAECTAANNDNTNVESKASDMKLAEKKADDAKTALKLASSALSTSTTGAEATALGSPGTRFYSDNSAKYVAEATRTIVSTTLLASFAQEECSRIWDLLEQPAIAGLLMAATENYSSANRDSDDARRRGNQDSKEAAQIQAKIDNAFKAIEKGRVGLDLLREAPTDNNFGRLLNTCLNTQKLLLANNTLYTPNYGYPTAALQVLGAEKPISLQSKLTDHVVELDLLGGVSPYSFKKSLNDDSEIKVTLDNPTRKLTLTRPNGAKLNGEKVQIYVSDATNSSYVLVTVSLDVPVLPALKVKEASCDGNGKFKITLEPMKDSELPTPIVNYRFEAVNTADRNKTLTEDLSKSDTITPITTGKGGGTYNISLVAVNLAGKPGDPAIIDKQLLDKLPLLCASKPIAPTDVTASCNSKGELTVNFKPSPATPGANITYQVTATNIADKTSKTSESKSASPITITELVAQKTYTAQVKATNSKGDSDPAPSPGATAKCE